jgi:hypothetical protein
LATTQVQGCGRFDAATGLACWHNLRAARNGVARKGNPRIIPGRAAASEAASGFADSTRGRATFDGIFSAIIGADTGFCLKKFKPSALRTEINLRILVHYRRT